MTHILFCLAALLNMQSCFASATAKVSEPAVKAPETEDKERVTEHKQRVAAVQEALPGVPRELVGIIEKYDRPIDPVIDAILTEAKRWSGVLRSLYDVVKRNMPTQAQLEEKLKAEHADYISDRVLRDVVHRSRSIWSPTNDPSWLSRNNYAIQNAYKALRRKYRDQWNQYTGFLAAQAILPPYGTTTLNQWKDGGFDQKAAVDRRSRLLLGRMVCPTCKAVINYPLPWMLPQYYHKRDCSKLAALQKADGVRYRIVKYGENVPQDASEYLSYTTLHLDIRSKGWPIAREVKDHEHWRTCWDLVIEYPAIIGFADYVLDCVVNGMKPEAAFKKSVANMRYFYWPLRAVTTSPSLSST